MLALAARRELWAPSGGCSLPDRHPAGNLAAGIAQDYPTQGSVMAGGAVVAAAAAAHAKRIQNVVDAFRLADATSPDRARALAELSLAPDAGLAELTKAAVLLPGRRAGTWYLSEAAYIARREARDRAATRSAVIVALIGTLILLSGVLIAVMVARGRA
jgi:hypothetical protein